MENKMKGRIYTIFSFKYFEFTSFVNIFYQKLVKNKSYTHNYVIIPSHEKMYHTCYSQTFRNKINNS